MTWAERAALEGLLFTLKPALSIELGMAPGGTLRRIGAHSDEVHSFARVSPDSDLLALRHVQFHTGDSHQRLPALLHRLARQGRNVDFVLVDGDRSTRGVRQDVADLLGSPAIADTLILLHDTMNEQVRRGIEQAGVLGFPKVAAFDLDAIPGCLFTEGESRGELGGGLGMIKIDARRSAYGRPPASPTHALSPYPVLARLKEDLLAADRRLDPEDVLQWCQSRSQLQTELRVLEAERDRLAVRLGEAERIRSVLTTSTSWKITRPLREAAAAMRGGR